MPLDQAHNIISLQKLQDPNRVLFIVGPTASGKTGLSLQIAKLCPSIIISADSRQIYKYMDIGTAKEQPRPGLKQPQPASEQSRPGLKRTQPASEPTPKDTTHQAQTVTDLESQKQLQPYPIQGIQHYLLDIVLPTDRYTVFDFKQDAEQIIQDHIGKQKVIVCGGTGLYVDSLINNYQMSTQKSEDVQVKQQLETEYQNLIKQTDEHSAKQKMFQKLQELDPERARDFHPHNIYSVIREIEFLLTNQSSKNQTARKSKPDFEYDILLLWPDRETLYTRINHRIDQQITQGLEQETQTLHQMFPGASTALSSLGYKQVQTYLQNPTQKQEQIELFKKLTRNYAKRQYTWFRRYQEQSTTISHPQDFLTHLTHESNR